MPGLSDLFAYGTNQMGNNGVITSLGQRENDLLNEIRKYDPNASWSWMDNSSSSNEGGSYAPSTYILNFDQSKLPDPGGPARVNQDGQNVYRGFSSGGSAMGIHSLDPQYNPNGIPRLLNDNFKWNSPYGEITDNRNIYHKKDMWGQILPMIPMVAAMIASGGTLSPLASLFVNGTRSLASGSGINLGSILGAAGSYFGLPGWASGAINYGSNFLANQGGHSLNVLALDKMMKNGLPRG